MSQYDLIAGDDETSGDDYTGEDYAGEDYAGEDYAGDDETGRLVRRARPVRRGSGKKAVTVTSTRRLPMSGSVAINGIGNEEIVLRPQVSRFTVAKIVATASFPAGQPAGVTPSVDAIFVTDIIVGKNSQLAGFGSNPRMALSSFSPASLDNRLDLDTASLGKNVIFRIEQAANQNSIVSIMVFGTSEDVTRAS